jgi:hypothetical protein
MNRLKSKMKEITAKISHDETREAAVSKEDKLDELKLASVLMRDKLENATDHIKDYCNSVRNSLQLQIEYQTEKLNKLYDDFFKEIDDYERSCIEKFLSNKELNDKKKHFLSKFDDKVSNCNHKDFLKDLTFLEDNIKLELKELESVMFQNSRVDFIPNDKLFDSVSVGRLTYRKSDTHLPNLQEMSSIDVNTYIQNLMPNSNLNVLRLSYGNFLVAFNDSNKSLQLFKVDSGGMSLRKADFLTQINNYKICKTDSNLYIFSIKSGKSSVKYNLLSLDFNFKTLSCFPLEESLSCLAANRKKVFSLKSDGLSILIYDKHITKQTGTFALPNYNISSKFGHVHKFHQMEASDESLFLLRAGEILILDASSGQTLKQLTLNASKFRCLPDGFLLLSLRPELKLVIYDVEKEVVYREKHYDQKMNLVLGDQLKDVAFFLKEDLKIYF